MISGQDSHPAELTEKKMRDKSASDTTARYDDGANISC